MNEATSTTTDLAITTQRTGRDLVRVTQGPYRSHITRADIEAHLRWVQSERNPGHVRHEGLLLDESQLLSIRAALAGEWMGVGA